MAERYGLARGNRERRWTVIVDVTLVAAAVAWVVVLRSGSAAPGLRWAVSLVLVAMVAHRVLLVSDRRRRRRRGAPAPAALGATLGAALETALETARESVVEPVLDAAMEPAVAESAGPAGPHAA